MGYSFLRALLDPLVLGDRLARGELRLRIRLLDDDAILHLPSQLGSVDLRLCPIFHSHLERASVLLRHVLLVQRSRPPISESSSLLAVLDVLD